MSNEINEKDNSRKRLIFRLIVLISYVCIMVYFYFLFIQFGAHPFITIILLIFIFLISISPFLRKNKKSLYSRMFPNRKRKATLNYQKKVIAIQDEEEMHEVQPKIPKSINLDLKYRRPIINKCENCGNIIPNFVKKCPFCNAQLKY